MPPRRPAGLQAGLASACRSALCQGSGPLTLGMLKCRLHGVEVPLQQPMGLRDGAPPCDRSCDLSQDFECITGIQAEVGSDPYEGVHARTRVCVVNSGAEVLRAGLWVGVQVKRRREHPRIATLV